MSHVVELRRALTARSIAQNPVTIVVDRGASEKVEDGAGGFIEVPATVPEQTVRIFMSTRRQSREIAQDGARFQVQSWGLLAMWDADLRREDKFSLTGRRFRIRDIHPVMLEGEVVSLQCELEELK